MENDKSFKALLESSLENASPNFTQTVIERIKANAVLGSVSNKWTGVFRITFIVISFLVVVLSFFITSTEQLFNTYINIPPITPQIIFWAIIYIFSFWLLIIFSFRLDKRQWDNFSL